MPSRSISRELGPVAEPKIALSTARGQKSPSHRSLGRSEAKIGGFPLTGGDSVGSMHLYT